MLFNQQEDNYRQASFHLAGKELACAEGSLEVLKQLVTSTHGSPKELGWPRWYAMLFSGQNLSLLDNAYELILRGYLASPQMLLRAAVERIVLVMYFTEFPDDEIIYRQDGHQAFYRHTRKLGYGDWLTGLLERVDREGKIYSRSSLGHSWKDTINKSVLEDASGYLHVNESYIYDSVRRKDGNLILGPITPDERSLRIMMARLIQTTGWTCIALEQTYGVKLTARQMAVVRHSYDAVTGVWKDYGERAEPSS